jgi:2',3'-cyclic-nucleotide 2'-phosphodiesterase/3'-nucleotidase
MNRTAIYLTAPAAKEHLSDIAHLKPEPCGQTPEGFLKLRLQF